MNKYVLRKKSSVRKIQWLLLSSPLFFFYPLLLLFQFAALESGILQSAGAFLLVVFFPPIYLKFLAKHYLTRILIKDNFIYFGPLSTVKKSLDDLIEVGGEEGSIHNNFREGIRLVFSDETEEVLFIDEFEESDLRSFLTTLKKAKPDCTYSYSEVIPLEARGLIKFIHQTSDADNLIIKQSKTLLEDSMYQLVNDHKKTFYSVYLAGWTAIVILFCGLTVTFQKHDSDTKRIDSVGTYVYQGIKDTFPDSFKEGSDMSYHDLPEANWNAELPNIKEGRWFESMLVRAVIIAKATAYYFSAFGMSSLMIVWGLIGFVLMFIIPIIRKFSPSHIFVDAKSIGQGISFFPWETIAKVKLEKKGEFADPMDGDLKLTSNSILNEDDQLLDGGYKLAFPEVETKIKLASIPDQNTRMKLLRLVERHAVDAHFNEEFIRTTSVSSDIKFTDLWLDSIEQPSSANLAEITAVSEGAETIANGRFRIKAVLGYGGQGTTYLADSTTKDGGIPNQVVVKELVLPTHADVRIIQDARLRFNRGAELLSKISNNQIVEHYEHFIEGSNAYLVMEYIPGRSLRKVIEEDGPMAYEQVLNFSQQILNILDNLHTLDEPVIHCDLAPDNLIVTDDGAIKLIDFDVARIDGKGATGQIAARPAYTPPEQFRGKPVIQSDIYAFGAIVHFLREGEDPAPFGESTDSKDEDLNDLEKLIKDCCQFEPGDRPETAAELIERVSSFLKSEKIKIPKTEKGKIA